jgi:hypothetical protein
MKVVRDSRVDALGTWFPYLNVSPCLPLTMLALAEENEQG